MRKISLVLFYYLWCFTLQYSKQEKIFIEIFAKSAEEERKENHTIYDESSYDIIVRKYNFLFSEQESAKENEEVDPEDINFIIEAASDFYRIRVCFDPKIIKNEHKYKFEMIASTLEESNFAKMTIKNGLDSNCWERFDYFSEYLRRNLHNSLISNIFKRILIEFETHKELPFALSFFSSLLTNHKNDSFNLTLWKLNFQLSYKVFKTLSRSESSFDSSQTAISLKTAFHTVYDRSQLRNVLSNITFDKLFVIQEKNGHAEVTEYGIDKKLLKKITFNYDNTRKQIKCPNYSFTSEANRSIYHNGLTLHFDSLEHFNCIQVFQHLNEDLYIEKNEFRNVFSNFTADFSFSTFIDQEVTSNLANQSYFWVEACTNQSIIDVKLPIHYRYQLAAENGKKMPIKLTSPYVFCSQNQNNLNQSSFFESDSCTDVICEVENIIYNSPFLLHLKSYHNHKEALIHEIPIGNSSHTTFYFFLTGIISLLGFLHILIEIIKAKQSN